MVVMHKSKPDKATKEENIIVDGKVDGEKLRREAGALLDEFKDQTDPTYVGPGTWNVIHRLAFAATTKDQQEEFINTMTKICSGFPCGVCRGHCTEYLELNPMREYLGIKIMMDDKELELGLFLWTWKFHNAVNFRIGKPIMSWDTAYNLYSDSESLVCSSVCAGTKTETEKTQKYYVPPKIESNNNKLINYGGQIRILRHQ